MLNLTLQQVLDKSKNIISSLHPVVALATEALIRECYRQNVFIRITHGYRSYAEQNALYNQGRFGNPGPIVTNAKGGQSNHNFRVAIDFVLLDGLYDMKADKDKDGVADWTEVVTIAKMLGFDYGGDWKTFKDYPHFEMLFGLSTAQWRNGVQPSASVLNAARNKIELLMKAWEGETLNMKELETLTAQLKEVTKENVQLRIDMETATSDLQTRLEKIEKLHNYPEPPAWVIPAVEAAKAKAKENGQSLTINGSSYDYLRFIQTLYAIGVTKPTDS